MTRPHILALLIALIASDAAGQTTAFGFVDADARVHLYHTMSLLEGDSVHVDRRSPGQEFLQITRRPLGVMDRSSFENEIQPVLAEIERESGRVGGDAVRNLLLSTSMAGAIYAAAYPPVARATGRKFVDTTAVEGQRYSYRLRIYLVGASEPELLEFPVLVTPAEPAPPTNLTATNRERAITIRWRYPVESEVVVRFEVFRKSGTRDQRVHVAPVLRILEVDTFSVDLIAPVLNDTISYYVQAIDVAGQASEASEILRFAAFDNVPPQPVGSVEVLDQVAPAIVTWTPSPSLDASGYRVYRAAGSSRTPISLSGILPTDSLVYRDSSVQTNRSYRYFVTALDQSGNESELGGGISYAVLDNTPPPMPAPVRVGVAPDGVTAVVTWPESSALDLMTYRVMRQRLRGARFSAPIVVMDSSVTSWSDRGPGDEGLDRGAYYRFSVAALDSMFNVSDTAKVVIQIPDTVPPGLPLNVQAHQTEAGYASVTWAAPPDRDLQATRLFEGGRMVEELGNGETGFVFRQVEYGSTYRFAVSAVDSLGNESGRSQEATLKIVDDIPPPVVRGLRVDGGSLRWVRSIVSDLVGYVVGCAATRSGPFQDVSSGLLAGETYTLPAGLDRWCTVRAVDTSGNEGPPSELVDIGGGG